jgi:tetratricopeptide (TPR) repeat protein
MLEATLAAHPLASIPHVERPYVRLVSVSAFVGLVDRARATIALFDRERETVKRFLDEPQRHLMLGDISMAERQYDVAVSEYRDGELATACMTCMLPRLARAYDLAGNVDSAAATFSRYLATTEGTRLGVPNSAQLGVDADFLAGSYKRLGELSEQKGDRQRALGYYLKFVELWKDADPELQPKVAEVRRRIARLKDVERK